ncbi:Sister chromatid cohesion protein pds5 [Saxophila tyrrhenica]|uniref:Sister chromatid cohesion protein pds5 n=1 Tax=Saxophila tyrrhenica TaxID=1690608 RepID=A0AAV9PKV2_9PEZI|nr:Sister chromatid cohesion protein pds5 [Saxophila tyrrhenica]
MPRPRNKAPSEPPAREETLDVEMDGAQVLKFNEPLTWRPGKPIVVTELLRRLKALSEELAPMQQEDADRETLVPKAQELASPQLLSHKDKGVKAYAMLCIVEMFRLLAPNAPYKSSQLKEIFALFTSTIVPALANPGDPYNEQHNAVLASLTTVKSVVLVTDIPGSDHILLNLFTNAFDVLAGGGKNGMGEKLPKNLEYHMTNMLCTLVDESEVLPTGVVDVILAQFLRADPSALSSGQRKGEAVVPEPPPAYNMARAVCNTCSEKLERLIGQYFNSVLVNLSEIESAKDRKGRGKKRTHDEFSDDESDDGLLTPPAESDMHEVEKAHRLLRELWRSCPDVIQNIVPQIEIEIQTESAWIRTMAVQTLGDMISGIGAAGPPPAATLDPAAYPSQSLEDDAPSQRQQNPLLTPNAPHAFSSVYPSAYQAFMDRYKDKAPTVRSAWATEAGRILLTAGGGKGLDDTQEKSILLYFSNTLMDSDEKVRLAAINTLAQFDFDTLVQKIGRSGSVATPGSVLAHLADRIKDRKHTVRCAATELLARIWGVAAGAIAEGNERIHSLVGAIPSKILVAWYVNDHEIHALIHRVMYDYLLPVTYPPIKARQPSTGDSQRVNDSQTGSSGALDPDAIRAERILVFVRDLDDRAKRVFFSLLNKRSYYEGYVNAYLTLSEEASASGGDGTKEAKKKLDVGVDKLVRSFDIIADPTTAAEHLKKFAKHHDRRSYQLIRFCYSAESDYRKIFKAMKELTKRMEEAPTGMAVVLDTLIALVRSAAVLVYNKSHVPAIVRISRTDEKGLGSAAHEVLKEISTRAPDIFKVHVHELCETLKKQTPSEDVAIDEPVVDTLKACAGFARRFPEGMPKDREFYKAMVQYSIRGMPPKAAKHAVTVIVSSADKKEMYIKDIQKACIKGFKYGEAGFLSKLASISQLRLLANQESEDHTEAIMEMAIGQVLGQVREAAEEGDPAWTDDIDDDLAAKLWALRILVNGLRGFDPSVSEDPTKALKDAATPVYKLLNTLIQNDGELSESASTPPNQKAHLRLAAAIHLLKLSRSRTLDPLLSQPDFNQLSRIAQDESPHVRSGFAAALKKYLQAGQLGHRFYGLVFLYAFEPDKSVKESTVTWLRSRAAMAARASPKDTVLEAVFPRFLALLAHHQDFSTSAEDLQDFVEYVVFYLRNVATQANLPLVYHYAQRLKTVGDAVDPAKSENLYVLSDIAESVIRVFQDVQGWSLQVMSGRVGLPSGLFSKLPSHAVAQEIAEKRYIPDELAEGLEDLVKGLLRSKKRKADGIGNQAAKKQKSGAKDVKEKKPAAKKQTKAKAAKTPKRTLEDPIPSSERRKSTRHSGAKNYAEEDDSEDDEELEQWQEAADPEEDAEEGADAEDDVMEVDGEANKENVSESTPPTSDPPPAAPESDERTAKGRAKKGRQGTDETMKSSTTKGSTPRKAAPKKAAAKSKAAAKPARSTRATRGRERDVMSIPSDSE